VPRRAEREQRLVIGGLADEGAEDDRPTVDRQGRAARTMVITIPTGSKGAVILTDLGFLRGYKISFRQSSSLKKTTSHTQVKVSVYAPNTGTRLPVKVTFAPRTLSSGLKAILFGQSASGYSNSWVTLKTG
jgi:hypothetical protein